MTLSNQVWQRFHQLNYVDGWFERLAKKSSRLLAVVPFRGTFVLSLQMLCAEEER